MMIRYIAPFFLFLLSVTCHGQWAQNDHTISTPSSNIIFNNNNSVTSTIWLNNPLNGPAARGDYYIKAYDWWGATLHFVGTGDNDNERLNVTFDGNVGIGTNNPLAKFHVVNGDNSYGAILAQANESPFQLYTKTITTQPTSVESFRLGLKYADDERNGYISFYRGGSSNGGFLGLSTNGFERIRIASDGNVGIGTTTPTNKLEVLGCTKTSQLKIDYPNVTENWDNEWQSGFFDAYYIASSPETAPNWFWGINIGHRSNNPDYRYGGQLLIKHSPNEPTLYFRSRGQDGKGVWAKVINSVGNQQIKGNLVVDGKLNCEEVNVAVIASNNINVSGTIQANDIRVSTQGRTADFVFAEDYKLKSLDEIAQYVQENKHLPDVPSAAQMEKEGISLAEMNKLLLQKIEELTLYSIELKREKEAEQKERIRLEQRIEKIEAFMNSKK
jgi:hypothetical protein